MNVLLATRSMNDYWHQIALALHEVGALGRYRTGYVDLPRTGIGRLLRSAARVMPSLDRSLKTRQVPGIPLEKIWSVGGWELARAAAGRFGCPTALEDWLFVQGEMRFDSGCAADLSSGQYDAVLTTEFGALETLRTARRLGRQSLVGFVSPHHRFREKWVDARVSQEAALMTPAKRRLMWLARERDKRRDDEMKEADRVLSCSPLVSQSLRAAGVPGHRIVTVPLGCPDVVPQERLERRASESRPLRVMYAGLLAAHKGVTTLLDAWKKLHAEQYAELHLYGQSLLPENLLDTGDPSITLHGAVGRSELFLAYEQADILVFPSLCDGFGAVVTEAFSQGLPAIVSENAGVVALIRDGENGFIVPAAQPDAIAEKLVWCLAHRQALAKMRRAAWETAKARSWPVFRAELRRAWSPVLEKGA